MSRQEDFRLKITEKLEERALKIVQGVIPNSRRANDENSRDTDFLIDGKYADFQFSTSFEKYKDIRFDLISCCSIKNKKTIRQVIYEMETADLEPYTNFQKFITNWVDIVKYGKVSNLQNSHRPNSLIYFIYNKQESELDLATATPDFLYVVKTDALLDYIKKNWKKVLKERRFKFNRQTKSDMYEGLFFVISAEEIEEIKLGYVIDLQYFSAILKS